MAKAKNKKKPADEKKPQLSIIPPEAKKSETDEFIKNAKTAAKKSVPDAKKAELPATETKIEKIKQTFSITPETSQRLIMAVATEKIKNPQKKVTKSSIIEAAIVQWLNKKKVVVD